VNYLDWIQVIKRISKLKEYNNENVFKLAILKIKGYVSLWYENLKKNRAREAKAKIKTWSKLSVWTRASYPLHESENYISRSHLLAKRISTWRSIFESLTNSK